MSSFVRYNVLEPPDSQPITARLSSAGSVRHELEDLLNASADDSDVEALRQLVVTENVTGKRTEDSRKKTWTNLKARYLLDPAYAEYRAFRAAMERIDNPQERGLICYLMMARTDRLFREVTLEEVSPHLQHPETEISPKAIKAAVEQFTAGLSKPWSSVTVERAWQHILTSLKDFGVIVGSKTRRTAPVSPGSHVIVFAAQLGRLEGLTDRKILGCRWFQLLGLSQDSAVDRLYTAAQQGVIRFRKQAEVVELHLPKPGNQ